MSDQVAEVAKIVRAFSENALAYAVLLAAVGTVTMALIELLKSVFDVRKHFNRWRIQKWVKDVDARRQLLELAIGTTKPGAERRNVFWVLLGEVRSMDVLYDQPAEKMMGQVQAVTNLALDFPYRYTALYRFLTGSSNELEGDAKAWHDYAKAVANGSAKDEDARPATQARARIGSLVTRSLDAFQNDTQYLWAEVNQRVAVLAAGGFLFWILFVLPEGPLQPSDYVRALCLAFFGGLLAPFAKDVVSALSGLSAKLK